MIAQCTVLKFYFPIGTNINCVQDLFRTYGGTSYAAEGTWAGIIEPVYVHEFLVDSTGPFGVVSAERILKQYLADNPMEKAALAYVQGTYTSSKIYVEQEK